MKYKTIILFTLLLNSCSFRNIGEHGPNSGMINYEQLPNEVKTAYLYEFAILKNSPSKMPLSTISLDPEQVNLILFKTTSIELIKPGKKIYKIDGKRFYIPWNRNREMHPMVLYKKNIYMLFTPTGMEKLNYYLDDNHKKMKYLKVDLSKYLKY